MKDLTPKLLERDSRISVSINDVRMAQAWLQADMDGSGALSGEELTGILQTLNVDPSA
eukprot:gene45213-12167_t